MPTLGLIVIPFLILVLAYVWRRRHLYKAALYLPGPPAMLPFIGNGLTFLRKREDIFKNFQKLIEPYPSPMRIWLGPKLVIVISDANQFQVVLSSSKLTTKAFIYKFVEPFLGKGLFTSKGQKHKEDRRLLQPFFGIKMLKSYSMLFQKHAERTVKILKEHANGETFNILPVIYQLMFETIIDTILEETCSTEYKVIPRCIKRIYEIFMKRIFTFWMHPDALFKLTSLYKEQVEMNEILSAVAEEVRSKKEHEINEQTGRSNKERKFPSVFEMMLEMIKQDPECMSKEDFKDHMVTFVAGSQDTQSTTIGFTLMMLGMHKNIQAKVMDEIKGVLGDRRLIYFEDTSNLKYLEMCLKEAMRLFPPAPTLPREVIQDFQLGKMTMPTDSIIALNVYGVHRDPKYWEKPEKFYPEHFETEAETKRHPFAYVPFSAGPRRCIAQHFSFVNMKIIVANILINYSVDCDGTLDELELMADLSIRPLNGYLIKLRRKV